MNETASPSELREHLLSLLKSFRTAMLVTHADTGHLHARPMAIADVTDDGRVWFVTGADTTKTREIQTDFHVDLICSNDSSAFLSLSGRASLVRDRQRIAELWREPFRIWFPGGKSDPSLELIAVRPERGEFWDNTGLNRCKYIWEAAKAYLTRTKPATHEDDLHATVTL